MERVQLIVTERDERGGRAMSRLRRQGMIPGVLYGAGKAALAFSVDAHALRTAMSTDAGRHAVLNVVFEGKKRGHSAVIKEIQLDRVKHIVSHVDLHEIHLNEPIETKITVQLEGTARGVKAGGLLDITLWEVGVRGLPTDIPEHLTLDVSEVDLGQVLRVKDLVIPKELSLLEDPEETVLSIILPRGAGAEEEVSAAAASEPELVGKGKEGEGAEE